MFNVFERVFCVEYLLHWHYQLYDIKNYKFQVVYSGVACVPNLIKIHYPVCVSILFLWVLTFNKSFEELNSSVILNAMLSRLFSPVRITVTYRVQQLESYRVQFSSQLKSRVLWHQNRHHTSSWIYGKFLMWSGDMEGIITLMLYSKKSLINFKVNATWAELKPIQIWPRRWPLRLNILVCWNIVSEMAIVQNRI